MDNPTPNTITATERGRVEQLVGELQQLVNDSSPLGLAIRERDHFHRMWNSATEDILKNMQEMRNDIRRLSYDNQLLRDGLDKAYKAGKAESEALYERLERIEQKLSINTPKPEPERKKGWFR